MKTAVAVGLPIMEFWQITPYELGVVVDDFIRKQDLESKIKKQEADNQITVAYFTAYWAARWFSKKPPESLEKILGTKKEKPKKKMTPEEMLSQVRLMNKALGGE